MGVKPDDIPVDSSSFLEDSSELLFVDLMQLLSADSWHGWPELDFILFLLLFVDIFILVGLDVFVSEAIHLKSLSIVVYLQCFLDVFMYGEVSCGPFMKLNCFRSCFFICELVVGDSILEGEPIIDAVNKLHWGMEGGGLSGKKWGTHYSKKRSVGWKIIMNDNENMNKVIEYIYKWGELRR